MSALWVTSLFLVIVFWDKSRCGCDMHRNTGRDESVNRRHLLSEYWANISRSDEETVGFIITNVLSVMTGHQCSHLSLVSSEPLLTDLVSQFPPNVTYTTYDICPTAFTSLELGHICGDSCSWILIVRFSGCSLQTMCKVSIHLRLNPEPLTFWWAVLAEDDIKKRLTSQPPKSTSFNLSNAVCFATSVSDFCSPKNDHQTSPTFYKLYLEENKTSVTQIGYMVSERTNFGLYGFNNETLIVGFLEWAPFTEITITDGKPVYSGICINLLDAIARTLNFSYQLVQPHDLEWGREVDGRWTGLLGLLVNKSVDLVISPLAFNTQRTAVIDYSVPYHFDQMVTVVKKPGSGQPNISVFTGTVYLCIFATLTMSSLLVFWLEELYLQRQSDGYRTRWKRYNHTAIYFLSSILRQGHYVPRSISGRTALWFWLLLHLMLVAIYSGSLIASIAKRSEKPPFKTIAEMVDHTRYTWGFIESTDISELFKTSSLREYRAVWEEIQRELTETPDILNLNIAWHMEHVLQNSYVFIGDKTSVISYKNLSCDLYITEQRIISPFYAMGFQKHSTLTGVFSQTVQEIYESGLLTVWYDQMVPKRQCKPNVTRHKRIDFRTLQSVFLTVCAAICLACVTLLGEILILKCKRQKET